MAENTYNGTIFYFHITVYTIMKGDWMFSNAACVGLGFMTMLTFVGESPTV